MILRAPLWLARVAIAGVWSFATHDAPAYAAVILLLVLSFVAARLGLAPNVVAYVETHWQDLGATLGVLVIAGHLMWRTWQNRSTRRVAYDQDDEDGDE